jgi:hypothetical protein
LTEIYNDCLKHKYIPKIWRKAQINLLPKEGDPSELGNYRPISLLCVQYKIYTHILNRRLQAYLEENRILSEGQAGFRKGMSTACHINTLINILEDCRQFDREIHLCYVDIKKAYDSVEHWAIEEALQYYGVPKDFVEVIMSLYKNITAEIVTSFGVTKEFEVTRGVRQGDVISPLLFNVVINPFLEYLNEQFEGYTFTKNRNMCISRLVYADDLVLIEKSRQEMEQMIHEMQKFSDYYGLEVNANKTEYTSRMPKGNNLQSIQPLCWREQPIKTLEPTEPYKYLGLWITADLNWNKD